jgi:hypothetical protein
MTNSEKKIINMFYLNEITRDHFIETYPIDLFQNSNYIYLSVREAFLKKDAEELNLALVLIVFNPSVVLKDEFVDLLCLLLRETWHMQHENIVVVLENVRSPKSIDTLYDTAITKFDYLDYDDSLPLAIKCIYALGAINTVYSKEKLKLLAKSNNPVIKKNAEKQL